MISCVSRSKESTEFMMDSISIDGEMFQIKDSVSMFYPSLSEDSVAIIKSEYTEELDTSKKLILKTKLDTGSNLPDIRKNMEVIDYQQKQLDSLLLKQKK